MEEDAVVNPNDTLLPKEWIFLKAIVLLCFRGYVYFKRDIRSF